MKELELGLLPIFEEYNRLIDDELKDIIQGRPLALYGMMSYHLGWVDENGEQLTTTMQSRIRPGLLLLSSEVNGGMAEKAVSAAAAIDLLHNFYLIHDDIQWGRPEREHRNSLWWVWGPAQGINAGDGMHAIARLALFRLRDKGVDDDKVFQAIQVLDEACLKLCEGQFLDLNYQERLNIGVKAYINMLDAKSGSLMECALKLGVLLGSGDKLRMAALGLYGKNLGIALQIQEEIKALWHPVTENNPYSADILNKKKSLPLAYVFEKADVKSKRQLGEMFFKRVLQPSDIEEMVTVLDMIGVKQYCEDTIRHLREEALDALNTAELSDEATNRFIEITRLLIGS